MQESPASVLEYVRGSSLRSGLQKLKQYRIPNDRRVRAAIALQAARGNTVSCLNASSSRQHCIGDQMHEKTMLNGHYISTEWMRSADKSALAHVAVLIFAWSFGDQLPSRAYQVVRVLSTSSFHPVSRWMQSGVQDMSLLTLPTCMCPSDCLLFCCR